MYDQLTKTELFRQLSPEIEAPLGALIIDGTGKALLPAGIDVLEAFHGSSFSEQLEARSKAAIAGGTATVTFHIISHHFQLSSLKLSIFKKIFELGDLLKNRSVSGTRMIRSIQY